MLGHVVEHADVDGGAALDALDVGGGLKQAAVRDLKPLVVALLQTRVDVDVALLVFPAASAPALVVASRHGHSVEHSDLPFRRIPATPPRKDREDILGSILFEPRIGANELGRLSAIGVSAIRDIPSWRSQDGASHRGGGHPASASLSARQYSIATAGADTGRGFASLSAPERAVLLFETGELVGGKLGEALHAMVELDEALVAAQAHLLVEEADRHAGEQRDHE